MPDPIPLIVQGDESVTLSPEELRVVNAVSPEATVEENEDGAEIIIKDLAHGTTRAQIYNGDDGISPTVTITPITGGTAITITDLDGSHTVTIYDGADGRGISNAVLNADYTLTITYTDGTSYTTPSIRGERGAGITSIVKAGTSGLVDTYTITYGDGQTATFDVTNGEDGHDGVSPAITISTITGGHEVTITDATHPNGQSFDVIDGTDGTTFTPSVAANGDLSWTNDGGKTNPATVNIKGPAGASGEIVTVTVSGSTPSITAEDNHRYICGEVATITITSPVSGICAVRFTSGSTAAVLTCSAQFPDNFDATALETNTIYEINILDGLALVAKWAVST